VAWGLRVFRKGRVGRIGRPFDGMLDFDPGTHFPGCFGMTVLEMAPRELVEAAQAVSEKRMLDSVQLVRQEFDVDADLKPEELEASARWGLALEDVVRQSNLNAVTMNFLDVAAAGAATMPFLGAARLMSTGIGYAGEGDVLTAALMASVARIAGQATFTEMFCPDYERGEILLSHMGECNFSLAASRPVKLMAKPFAFGDCLRPAVPVFQLRPGGVTLASLTQWPNEGFRLVVCTGEILAAPEHANLRSPYSRIRFGRPLPEFLEAYSRAGGTHHLALGYGDLRWALQTFARFAGMGFQVA
jgi:L-arabinose isomerase